MTLCNKTHNDKLHGNVFNIQLFTLDDGPGIRTELFLKGCPLRCQWCGNPESFKHYIQPGIYTNKCIGKEKCGACIDVCPDSSMLTFVDGKLTDIDRSKCTNCLKCHDACPSDAVKQWGNTLSIDECMKIIRKDKGFYQRSGGGVTVSGGDPIGQADFVAELFKTCQAEDIHTCLESSFYGKWSQLEKILPHTNLVISDIKHMDTQIHKAYTGVYNERILANLKKLAAENIPFILRIPVIPNVNDDDKNIQATADFIVNELDNKVRTLQLLSFMRLGEEKYQSLGLPYPMTDIVFERPAFQQKIKKIAEYFNSRGIHCVVGTKEK
ncbi:glycyl-radical enzyme activating protein [Photobacterium aphoticum]|uniref:Glycerol dehydratase n=1 Tax=Photobacterium aphoticum TaxID=754436 RepID=A0A0J1GMI2_9GAMM|nr:glycyl-radical enzyme activating protein [Photobacterium aphoticum]KLV00960.1 glycerol dehydratase [Photobacterium aphoticum]PSU58868.1 glycyl-radical enzyme activating protein [Photobacterium aphoticum]GHA58335.1 pyruvate formate lyase-activating protein [Photobacterium aphoticum]